MPFRESWKLVYVKLKVAIVCGWNFVRFFAWKLLNSKLKGDILELKSSNLIVEKETSPLFLETGFWSTILL
jgi:hypothetical protein